MDFLSIKTKSKSKKILLKQTLNFNISVKTINKSKSQSTPLKKILVAYKWQRINTIKSLSKTVRKYECSI